MPERQPDVSPAEHRLLAELSSYARVLDASVPIPGTRLRFGADAVLGLVPVLGDWAGVGLSSYVVLRAWRAGVRRSTLTRMLVNLGIEGLVGSVPIAGDLFDVWFRANQRNVKLLRQDLLARSYRPSRRSDSGTASDASGTPHSEVEGEPDVPSPA
jgi:hypothetical protein